MKKSKSILSLLLTVILIVGLGFTVIAGIGKSKTGAMKNIKLGLDLAGGVSKTEMYDYHNIHVVYTREAETADQYIEKFAHENGRKYRVTVATSDGLEQIIIRGAGCGLISARELEKEITRKRGEMLETYQAKREPEKKVHMAEHIPDEVAEAVRKADFHE